MSHNDRKQILVTDSLFIFADHIAKMEAAGFEVERLDKPAASEDELIAAIEGKHGYILGGIEKVTDRIIAAGDKLQAIVFTGADWRSYIPGHRLALEKGIHIANAPGANARAVAEYTLTLMLAMKRNIFELGAPGSKSFESVDSLLDASVGIVGLGTIGQTLASMLHGIGVSDLRYYSLNRKQPLESRLGLVYESKKDLFCKCDVVTLHTSKAAGESFVTKEDLASLRDGSLIIDCSFEGAIDLEALFAEVESGRLRAAVDHLPSEKFKTLPMGNFYHSNAATAFNTRVANRIASDMATESILNMLNTGTDQHLVSR